MSLRSLHVLFIFLTVALVGWGCSDDSNSGSNSSINNNSSNNIASNNTASNNTASNNTASNNTASNNTASNNTTSNNTTSNNTTSNNTNTVVCGDGIVGGTEDCDGVSFGGADCKSLGFLEGTLFCNSECIFDVSSCVLDSGPACGDGIINGGDQCEGNDLGGSICEDFDFDGGVLTCSVDCAFDTLACEGTAPECGDGVINGAEQCEGFDVGGVSCEGLGFDVGIVACGSDCTLDTSDCEVLPPISSCGDGVLNAGEECDDGNTAAGDGCAADCTTEVPDPVCGDGTLDVSEDCDDGNTVAGDGCAADCTLESSTECGDGVIDVGEDCEGGVAGVTCLDEGFDGGALSCSSQCLFDFSACLSGSISTPSQSGDLVFTEIMAKPETLSGSAGEWFELYNTRPGIILDLEGCKVESFPSQNFNINDELLIPALSHATFATGNQPGFTPTKVFSPSQLRLDDGSDYVRLICGGVVIDEVSYDSTFPNVLGASMNLDPDSYSINANDDATNWCLSTSSYNGDLGTPGESNAQCP